MPASAAMNRFGGVPAMIRLVSGLSPAVSCGTDADFTVLPVLAVKASRIVLSAAISLSFDQVWNSVSSTALAAIGADAERERRGRPHQYRDEVALSLSLFCLFRPTSDARSGRRKRSSCRCGKLIAHRLADA